MTTPQPAGPDDPGLAPAPPRPRLHVVLLAHLDTQWRWTERDTVARFLPATVDANEALFARFPRYVLSFEGAYRYQLLAEHDPARFERVRARVGEGSWHVAGAPLDAFDANLPAPESILRHLLYGARWLEHQLGVAPSELLLPDCFGFPASLPTLLAHAGIAGFSTQKLRKGAQVRVAFGVPFDYGVWVGPDGSEVLAALDPGEYGKPPRRWPGDDPEWVAAFARSGSRRRMAYFGVGDKGGALAPEAVARLEREPAPSDPIEVEVGASDRIFRSTTAAERARLPRHRGDLLLRRHGVGCYSANAGMKRWNRTNERLARAAELAAALAWRLGRPYPAARLERAWTRFLVRQMHDDLTGTAIPAAYRLSYGDEALAANDFAELLLDSLGEVARALDRSGPGWPVLVFDPHAGARRTLVEIELPPEKAGAVGGALDPEGRPLPCQRLAERRGRARLLVALETRGGGCTLVRLVPEPPAAPIPADAAAIAEEGLALAGGGLEARLDGAGNLADLTARALDGALLAGPVRLELRPDRPAKYPAWEIAWEDHAAPPFARFGERAALEVVERGPLRAAIRVTRRVGGSRAVETWRLAAGHPWLEADCRLDWRTRGALLALSVRAAAASPTMLCDLGVGAVERPLASPELYEVPAWRWTAIAPDGRAPGLALLCDERSGRAHPDPQTLRLTLIHSPATLRRFPHQATQDFGRHRFRWALAPLPPGDAAQTANRLAAAWCETPIALAAEPGAAAAGSRRRIGLVDLGADAAALLAAKRAEGDDRLVLRLRAIASAGTAVRASLAEPARAVEELDALERRSGVPGRAETAPPPDPAHLELELLPGSLRTLALDLGPAPARRPVETASIPLHGRHRGFSRDGERVLRGFDDEGRCFPAEITPLLLEDTPVPFDLGPALAGAGIAEGDGHTIEIPAGWAELWCLGASVAATSVEALFELDGRALSARFPPWRRPLAAPDRLLLGGRVGRAVRAGWARREPLAWYATHLHERSGRNLAGERGALFAVRLRIDGAGGALRFPAAPALRLVAATLARSPARLVRETAPLFETFGDED